MRFALSKDAIFCPWSYDVDMIKYISERPIPKYSKIDSEPNDFMFTK